MSAKEQGDILVVVFVCGEFAWAPLGVLSFREPLPVSMIVSNALGVLVWWAFMFLFGLILRDTILRRGTWCINLKRAVCSQCGKPLLKMTFYGWLNSLWNGWSCHECGFRLNKWGRPVKEQNTLAKWAVLRASGDAKEGESRREHLDERFQTVNDQTQRGDVS